MKKIVIVGGVAGGASAAARLRRLNEEDKIILFEKDEYISFANCGLPYYIGEVITEHDALIVQSVEGLSKRFNLDIRNFSEVLSINKEEKSITVRNRITNEEYVESFDVIILSLGASPVVPLFEGLKEANNIFTLRNIKDTDTIVEFIHNNQPKHATVIGGGFIGVEMAENLVERGMNVTLVEKMPQVLAPLDYEMAQLVHKEVKDHGVDLKLTTGVVGFKEEGKKVVLDTNEVVSTDLIIMAIGVKPTSNVAKDSFLLGPRGHIIVNEKFEMLDLEGSIIKDFYAVGDVIEVVDYVNKSKTAIPLAWPANRQGRLVADVINGKDVAYKGSVGSSVIKVFDLTIATTGNNERTLKMKNMNYTAIHAHRGNHAGYYPDASNIALKLLFDPQTKQILGAQGVGKEGTEKRIDVIATALQSAANIDILADLELCYAPPYSSAKDPVNILGYIAENISDEVYKMYYVEEVASLQQEQVFFLDVRTPSEFTNGHIEGAINIEIDALRQHDSSLPKDKNTSIYVNCQVGLRGYLAIQILKSKGYTNLFNLSGGYTTYLGYTFKA